MTPIMRRTLQKSFLTDTCVIRRPEARAKGVLDKGTGQVTVPPAVVIYPDPADVDDPGVCGIASRAGDRQNNEAGGEGAESSWLLKLPVVLTTYPRRGDEVTLGGTHPSMSGSQFKVERALTSTSDGFTQLVVSRVDADAPSVGSAAT